MTQDENTHESRLQRIDDCRSLYLKYNGKNHELIERDMRELGHADFHRRIMYDRFERGRHRTGWIGLYGFKHLVKEQKFKQDRQDVQDQKELKPSSTTHPAYPVHPVKFPTQRLGVSAVQTSAQMPDFPAFQEWLKTVSPTMHWDWKHQVYIYKRLRRVFEGDCKRLMIFLPPRHGKSELVTVRYAAWCLKQDPSLNVIIGSYNQRLANRFSRKVRRVLTDDHALTAETLRREKVRQAKARGQAPRRLRKHEKNRPALRIFLSVSATLRLIKRRRSRSSHRGQRIPRPSGKLRRAAVCVRSGLAAELRGLVPG